MSTNFLVTTTSNVEGADILKYIGVISTNTVVGTNVFSDLFASFTDFFGGFSGTYENKLSLIYNRSIKDLKTKAFYMGANCVLNLRIDFDEISAKGKSMFMVSVSGTAVIIQFREKRVEQKISNVIKDDILQTECSKRFIIHKVLEDKSLPSREEWLFLQDNPIDEISEHLLIEYIGFKKNIGESDAKSLLLANLAPYLRRVSRDYILSVVYKQLDSEPNIVLPIIEQSNLFSAQYIIDKFDSITPRLLSMLVSVNQESYTIDDLNKMDKILNLIDSKPSTRKIGIKKSLLGKEKEKAVCVCGCANDIDDLFCSKCGINDKGFILEEQKKIDRFRIKVESLRYLLDSI